ncbi:Fatty acyl-CoA reductase wat, partial [Fusarium oxysporum f. sp. albedinis]
MSKQNRASLGKTLAGENPKAARTLLCGRGSRLIPRSPGKLCTISTQRFCLVVSASETNCRSPAVFRAAAEAAKKKRVSGQYATTEIGHAASELQKGQRAIWGPCVEIRGHQRAQEVEQLAAAGVVRAAKAAEGATTLNVERQDAANVVWAARAAEVGRTGSRGAQSPDCRRLAKPE